MDSQSRTQWEKARAEFIQAIRDDGLPMTFAATLMSCARVLQAFEINASNREITEREKHEVEVFTNRVNELAKTYGVQIDTDGDPRGYVVRIHLKSGKSNSWGGGWGVPVKLMFQDA